MPLTDGQSGGNPRLALECVPFTSEISTNSLATLGASEAAGLKGPGLLRAGSPTIGCASEATAASRSRPVLNPAVGVNIRRSAGVLASGATCRERLASPECRRVYECCEQ